MKIDPRCEERELQGRWRGWVFCLGIVVSLLFSGCAKLTGSDPEKDRQQIEALLAAYLPKLAEAYATRDAAVLEGFAVLKEIATVSRLLDELTADGRLVKPTLKQVTVEDFSVWNHANAFVSTFEVWDLRVYSTGSEVLLSESLGQRNRVKYQMKRDGDSWMVLLRQIEQTLD